MKQSRLSVILSIGIIFLGCLILLPLTIADSSTAATKKKRNSVWLVFFFSKDCPHCERVKDLTDALKVRYPIRVKSFDIDNELDYTLYARMEAIHSSDKFSVPLIIVGDDILIGEKEITAELEKKVQRLSEAGGAALPYLEKGLSRKPSEKPACSICDSKRRGKPPSVQEELGKMKIFVDKYF